MINFQLFFQLCTTLTTSPYFFIPLHTISFIILSQIILNLIRNLFTIHDIKPQKTILIFFLIPIVAIMLDNSSWIIRYFLPKTIFSRSITCIAWIFCCIKLHFFILFLEQLTEKNFYIKFYHKIFFAIEAIVSSLFIVNTIHIIQGKEPVFLSINAYYIVTILWFIGAIKVLQELSNKKIPLILKEQLKSLLFYFIFPHFIFILLEYYPIIIWGEPQIKSIAAIEGICIAISMYFCFKKIIRFRFLNISKRVQITRKFSSDIDFKEAIEQINLASTTQELSYIIQQYLSKQFDNTKITVHFYIRAIHDQQNILQQKIEYFLNASNIQTQGSIGVIHEQRILVRHELEFDEFYTDNPKAIELAEFMRSIETDIFIPVMNNKKIIAYITITQEQKNLLLSEEQLNKIIIFTQFLAPAIHLLLQKDLYHILQDNKATQEALYEKNQEIGQYKESIKQLLKDRVENHIGIILYKNRHFALKNAEAQKLLTINPNLDEKHPTTAILSNFVEQIEKYQTTQNMCITVSNGSKIIITGMPQADINSGILLIIRKPEATDLIKMYIDNLKDPSKRDYLLYLQTTQVGQKINKLIPCNDEPFLQVKIELLKSMLQKSILFLQGNQDDRTYISEMIHNITNDSKMVLLDAASSKSINTGLFGINELFSESHEPALLEKYNDGSIVINNIELLNMIAQQKLVQYIKYGIFTPYKSEQRKFSNARIICSSNYDLATLIKEEKIIPELATEIKKHILEIPSLVTMNENIVHNLIDQIMFYNLQEYGTVRTVALSFKEKEAIISQRIPSFFELQQKIISAMSLKAQNKLELPTKVQEYKIIDSSCPELQLAAQLGKHALKDVQLMKKLWNKLGSQTKIAELLGVNRSSVSRRCKDYHLL
ncbi:sigma 54-interacting transcriptional regulator [Candidatus Dependentiae bacterium]|nr:sigma 54-interacting transcriptional regulator [Candidatus Dependentiae bacterium]